MNFLRTPFAQLRSIPTITGLLSTKFLIPLVLVLIYSSLPLLLKQYAWIPGDDHRDYLHQMESFPGLIRYYGAIPAKFLPFDNLTSLYLYYYSTPIFVFLGLHYSLREYSWWAPSLAWIALFFMTPVILQDMEAGTFVGVIGFYFVFLSLLKLSLKTSNPIVQTCVLASGILFHTLSGVALAISYITSRRPSIRSMLPLAPLLVIAAIWGLFLSASTIHVLSILDYTYTEAMTITLFLKQYLGVSTLVFLTYSLMMVYNLFKFKMIGDRFVLGLLGLVPTFIILSFSPYHLNSDRLSKLLVGVLVILAVIGIAKALEEVRSKHPKAKVLLFGASAAIVVLMLFNTASAQFSFWMGLGTYTLPIL